MSAYEPECEHRYDYEPLSSTGTGTSGGGNDNDAFRLLLLEPSAARADQLRGSLRNTTLAECDYDLIDPYTALSYVWGTSERACRIRLVDGGGREHLFAITASLDDALRDLRDPTRVRRVWADALCIDQDNVDERNAQVRLMGQIYSTAHSTVIHLGHLTPDVTEVFSVPRDFAPEPGTDNGESTAVAAIGEGGPWSLLSKTWFERVWVFQELVLSRDPWVQCGSRRIRWREFCAFFLGAAGKGSSPRAQNDEERRRVLADMNASWASQSRLPLHRAIKARRGLGATNPADFVYATFGIISDLGTVEQYLQIDYNMSVGRTFGKVAQYMFYELGIEQMVFHVDDAPASKRVDGLPSWAPDWNLEASYTKKNPLCMIQDNSLDHIRVKKEVHHAFTQSSNSDLPLVMGHIGMKVDKIKHVSCVMPSGLQTSYLTTDYDTARSELMGMYRNAYASGDRFGQYRHVPLKGKEAEHERLCRVVGTTWAGAVENSHRQSSVFGDQTGKGDTGFLEALESWLTSEASKKREFVGSGTNGVIKRLYGYFARTGGDSDLEGRRLASTEGGRMSIVPAQASAGDVIAYLVGSNTPVVLRSRDAGVHGPEIEHVLLESLRQPGCGVVTMTNEQKEEELWRVPRQGEFAAEHFSVIGEAYLDGHVGWALKYLPKESDMRIFALH
ncbi:HET domain-containing protein [Colletotrichum costaricense]|uniref:HET domain-containing protein n=1 Tax=Colletotrichum costaricense TaxID=1209916 RepID=A0AAI9YUR7_9PEZI|nr:HET domain-containing protein [Colletotrichum costaricense]KAK1523913.1 HET domain-containing protein [Colletotrichum costaricense]